jgi:hypothetical protein
MSLNSLVEQDSPSGTTNLIEFPHLRSPIRRAVYLFLLLACF